MRPVVATVTAIEDGPGWGWVRMDEHRQAVSEYIENATVSLATHEFVR